MSEQEIIEALEKTLKQPINNFVKVLENHKERRIWICGNGGSASTAIHFASDLRNLGFDVVCMNENTSRITAIVNDISWNDVYTEQMRHFKSGDVLIVISVHGGSKVWSSNLVLACVLAQKKAGAILAFLGGNGGEIKKLADFSIIVPHEDCYVVEGIHCVLVHLICEKMRDKI